MDAKIINEIFDKITANECREMTRERFEQAIRELEKQMILDFINWHNGNYPENYICNSKLGKYLTKI